MIIPFGRSFPPLLFARDNTEEGWPDTLVGLPRQASDDKKRARLNVIRHRLERIPYEDVPRKKIKLPERQSPEGYKEPDYHTDGWRRRSNTRNHGSGNHVGGAF